MTKARVLLTAFLFCTVALAISSCFVVSTVWAQQTQGHYSVLTNPEVNHPIQFDISPPLREMATTVSAQTAPHEALPVRRPKLQQLAAQQGRPPSQDGALQTSSLPLVNASIDLNLLGVGNGFPNYTVPGPAAP